MEPYPNHSRVHFLYLGRIMKEKGIEELFYAVRRLKEENEDFVLIWPDSLKISTKSR